MITAEHTVSELVKTRVLRPGDVVTVHRCHGGPALPQRLPEQTRLTVQAVDLGYADLKDDTGRIWHVNFSCIEMPKSVWWRGQWIDRMTHPAGERAYRWAAGGLLK